MNCYVVSFEGHHSCGDEMIFTVEACFYNEQEAYKYALEKNMEYLDEYGYLDELKSIMNDKISLEEKLSKYIRLYDYSNGNLKYEGTFYNVHLIKIN